MANGAELQNLNSLLGKLKELGRSPTELRKPAVEAMQSVTRLMKQKAPKDSGILESAIQVVDESTDTEVIVKAGVFAGDSVKYAVYQEYGTGLYAENGQGRQTPWLWEVRSEKWAAIFGIDVGDCVIWHGNHPHPFVRPAWDERRQGVYDYMKGAAIEALQVIIK